VRAAYNREDIALGEHPCSRGHASVLKNEGFLELWKEFAAEGYGQLSSKFVMGFQ